MASFQGSFKSVKDRLLADYNFAVVFYNFNYFIGIMYLMQYAMNPFKLFFATYLFKLTMKPEPATVT